jgi:hypothetical protein
LLFKAKTGVAPLFYKGFRFASMNKPDYRFALAKFTLLFLRQVLEAGSLQYKNYKN